MALDRKSIQAANDATYAAWNSADADGVASIFAEDAVLIDAGAHEPVRGREAIFARAVGLLAAFADFHLERVELLIDPPANADRWVVSAIHRASFWALPPAAARSRSRAAPSATSTRPGWWCGTSTSGTCPACSDSCPADLGRPDRGRSYAWPPSCSPLPSTV